MTKCAELANLIGNINAGGGGANKNAIINGSMNVSQRGASLSMAHDGTKDAHLIDRFRLNFYQMDELDGTYAQVSDDPLGGSGNALKWTTGTAESAIANNEYAYVTQKIEAQNLQHIQNGNSNAKSLTLSFYVKSSITGTFAVGLYKNDNTARIFNKTYTIDSANTWEKKTLTFAGDTSGGGIDDDNGEGIWIIWHLAAGSEYKGGGATSGWSDYANNKWADGHATDAVMTTAGATWLMTQCQLELGQNPTSFEHEPFSQTLQKCLRYTFVHQTDVAYGFASLSGFIADSTTTLNLYQFPVEMRAIPTLAVSGTFQSVTGHAGNSIEVSSGFTILQPNTLNARVDATLSSSNTLGRYSGLRNLNDSDAKITFDAEL